MSSNNAMPLQMTTAPSFDLSTFGRNDYDHLNGLVLLFNVGHNVRILVPRAVLNNSCLEKIMDRGTGKLVPMSYKYFFPSCFMKIGAENFLHGFIRDFLIFYIALWVFN